MLKVFTNSVQNKDLVQWGDLPILLKYDNQIQPTIEVDSVTFVNDTAKSIIDHIKGGLNGTSNGIFEGIPQKLTLENGKVVFDGYIDLTDDFEIVNNSKVTAKLKSVTINDLKDQLSGITTEYLIQKGFVKKSDYTDVYIVTEKEFDVVAFAQLTLTIFLLKKEIKQLAKEIQDEYAEFTALSISSLTSLTPAIIMKAIKFAIKVVYFAFLVIQLAIMVKQLLEYFIQVPRKNKCIDLKTLLERFLSVFGYTLNTTLPLNSYYILPTNGYENEPQKTINQIVRKRIKIGVPSAFDFGYIGDEVFETIERLFDAKFVVNGNVVECHNEKSNYWIKNSSYVMPSVLDESVKYNTEELNNTVTFQFETDIQDTYTISEYKGTIYEQVTIANKVTNKKFSKIKNYEAIQIPYALPSRKTTSNEVEILCLSLAKVTDQLIKFLGGNSNFVSKINKVLGSVRISGDYHTKAKLLYLTNGYLPKNYKEKLSAKYFFTNFHISKSFVRNNYYGQEIKKSTRIPFTISEFEKVNNNAWFKTANGEIAYFEEIEWFPDKDYANVKYRIKKPYTKNLKEEFYEPE